MPDTKFLYNQSINGIKDSRVKGLMGEISTLIEEGLSDTAGKKSAIPYLFNEEKSDKAIERHVIEDGYDLFDPQLDGDAAKSDKTNEIGHKDISHVIYSKVIDFTETMLEDAAYKMDPSIKVRSKELPSAYWKTRERVAQGAYINGESESFMFRGAKIDTTTFDGKPLFSKEHTFGNEERGHAFDTQSNLYYIDLKDKEALHAGNIAEILSAGGEIINQMLNSNGEPQDFDADTVFVPRGVKTIGGVDKVRRALGSEYFPGTSLNDINTQKGAFDFVPLSNWHPDTLELMIMSQEAKEMLNKAMFYNRVSLGINVWRDERTGTIHYRGRGRWGLGFVDYKHVIKLKIYTGDAPSNIDQIAEKLEI